VRKRVSSPIKDGNTRFGEGGRAKVYNVSAQFLLADLHSPYALGVLEPNAAVWDFVVGTAYRSSEMGQPLL
jgi:hypothetical protein